MNEGLRITDKVTMGKGKRLTDEVGIAGEVLLMINGKTIVRNNFISTSLLAYFASCFQTPLPGFIRSAELFDEDGETLGGTQDGKDGMVFKVNDGTSSSYYTFQVLEMTAFSEKGKRWKGSGQFNAPAPGGGVYELEGVELGRGFASLEQSAFMTQFARKDADAEASLPAEDRFGFPLEIEDGSDIYIEWEIYFSEFGYPSAPPEPEPSPSPSPSP